MPIRKRTGRALLGAAAVALSVVGLTACGGSSKSGSSGQAKSITVWAAVGAPYDWQKGFLSDFTRKTGIKVNYKPFSETSLPDKLSVAQQAKSSDFSIFESPQSSTSQYLAYHGIAPISGYLAKAPASYQRSGVPAGETGQCTLAGVVYCLPVALDGGPQLFYNKQMFSQAGIASPPQTWDDVLADAQKLTTGSQAGICMRGSEAAPNGYPVLLMLPYFLPYSQANKGEYLDPSWKPLFNTPQAMSWANTYSTLMQKYAPNGVGAYEYTDCQHAFQNGQVAMWWDDSVLGPTLYDPAQSKNAAQTGFAEIPCPSFNQTCLLSAPWGIYINPNVSKGEQDAAWQYIQYITSPAVQQKALTATKNPAIATRPATLSYAIAHAKQLGAPVDFLAALRYGIQHIEVNAIPVTPAFAAVQAQLFVILSNVISGKSSPAVAVGDLQTKMTTTLHRFKLG